MPTDPYLSCNFLIEISGESIAAFQECSAIKVKIDVVEYREGGSVLSHKLPGKVSYDPIVLKWGVGDEVNMDFLYEWHKNAANGTIDRRDGAIIQLGHDKVSTVMRWEFKNAWPSGFETGLFKAGDASATAIETLTLVCERIERVRV